MRVEVEGCRLVKPRGPENGDDDGTCNVRPLSSADFGVPWHHVRAIYAFEAPAPPEKVLEAGLATVLTHFRQWAGRLTTHHSGRLAIHLNDQGVAFVEARADGPLAQAMPFHPTPSLLQFLPPTEGAPELLLIQITRFTCGGVAIGVASHHLVSDGVAVAAFLNGWAQTVRGEAIRPLPLHDRSLLTARHPPRPIFDHIEYASGEHKYNTTKNTSDFKTKKLGFGAELVNRLKRSASVNGERRQSGLVSVLSHLWRCVCKARGVEGEVVSRARLVVDARNRLSPPLPPEYAGNAVFIACAQTTVRELVEQPLQFAANLISNAISRMDDEYVRSAIDYLESVRDTRPIRTDEVRVSGPDITASSWMNLALYDLDFGWGKPVHAGPSRILTEGLLIFSPRCTGGGIDVVVGLFEPHMTTLEQICYTI